MSLPSTPTPYKTKMSSNPSIESLSKNQLARKPSVIAEHPSLGHTRSYTGEFHKKLPTIPQAKPGVTIGVFTSGGDSSGMNATVRAVVRMALYHNCKIFFVHEGYQGMVDDVDGEYIKEATWKSVSGIIHEGGTVIGSARCPEFRNREGRLKAAANLVKYGINNLVVVGGDGSLTGANLFRQEWPGLLKELLDNKRISQEQMETCSHLNIVGMVGSIDNDFCGTDMTIGTDTALHRILESIDAIVTTASSHQRTFILEVMGRHCGYLALVGALTSEADYMFIPEFPPKEGWEKRMCDKLVAERDLGQRLNIIIVAEGAKDRSGKDITSEMVRKIIVDQINQDARITVLGHVQRGGNPSAFDRILGCRMGAEAVIALLESTPETEPCVISLDGNQAVRLNLMKCVRQTQDVATAMSEGRFDDAVKLRGKSFERNLEVYRKLSKVTPPHVIKGQGFRCGVVCIGAPACGMNAAIRSFVRSIILRGGQVFACIEGINGLLDGDVKEMLWTSVNGLTFEAGTSIGSRRTTVSDPGILASVVQQIQENNLHGLFIIGGFEAFQTCLQLFKARQQYPALNIPLCIVPATISNNVPGTHFSIGCDTAVNEITEICDRIRKSAEGSRKRVFIIETMGGFCGYLSTMAGLAGGADQAYIFEEAFGVKDIIKDVDHMISKMKDGVLRGLVLRNENANSNYDTNFIYRLFSEEGEHAKGKDFDGFTSRMNILGHMQQGAQPSPFDRNLGTKSALKAANWMMDLLESNNTKPSEFQANFRGKDTCVLWGLIGRHYKATPVADLEQEADFKHRLPKDQWYLKLRPLLRILARHDSTYVHEKVLHVDPATEE